MYKNAKKKNVPVLEYCINIVNNNTKENKKIP